MIAAATRRVFHAHPLLHSALLRLRGARAQFPARDDDLFLTGYPRSANSFSLYLARSTFPELRIVGYVHTHGSVRLARKFGMPVMILLRAPHDAVSSLLHMRAGVADQRTLVQHAKRALEHYIEYHCYIEHCLRKDNGAPIRTLQFDALIDRLEAVVDCVNALPIANIDRNESRREVGYFGAHKNHAERDAIRSIVGEQALLAEAQSQHARLSNGTKVDQSW